MRKILLISDERTPEDPGRIADSESYGIAPCNLPNLKSVIQTVGGCTVKQIHHTQLAELEDYAPDGLVLSGRFTAWDNDGIDEEYGDLLALLRETELPTLGICAGLQLIARAYGAKIAPMADTSGEHGFTAQSIERMHPLLHGLEDGFSCMELHCDEVQYVPDGFDLLVSTPRCKVQMLAHRKRPMFGTQFHSELLSRDVQGGRRLLENFFALY